MLNTLQLQKPQRKGVCAGIAQESTYYNCICLDCRWEQNTECVKRRAQGHEEAVAMMEKDLRRLDMDSIEIDMRMQALKPQILKLTEDKNQYHKYVLTWASHSAF